MGFCDLHEIAVGSRQLNKFDLPEVLVDVAPGVPAGVLGQAFEQLGDDAQRDVAWMRRATRWYIGRGQVRHIDQLVTVE